MAGRSKEAERQNVALKNILDGKPTEKRSMVGYQGKKEENLGGKTRKSELTDIMSEVRMPLFCKKCKKTMKRKLDDKFWRTQGHCFDCQIEIENRMRIEGTFEEYAKTKMLENQKAYLKDMEQSLDDFEKTGGKKEWFNQVGVNNPELESEKWEMGEKEFEKTISEARDFIREKRELVEEAEQQLTGAE